MGSFCILDHSRKYEMQFWFGLHPSAEYVIGSIDSAKDLAFYK